MMYLTREEQIALYPEFEKQALPHIDALYNYALRITGNKKYASGLLKETYLRAFGFYKYFVEGADHKIWLFRIMQNIFIKKFRNKIKEPEYNEEELENSYIRNKTYYKQIDNNLIDDKSLSRILTALPENFRTVIILCDIEGFSYEQIAEFIDIPEGVVRSRLFRGRKMLYNNLLKEGIINKNHGDPYGN